LTEDVTVAGPITVNLTGSTSGSDCDWIVKVIDVFPDTLNTPQGTPPWVKLGGYQMMVRGDVLRGKFRNSLAQPEAIIPNTPAEFKFDLQDVFHRFKKGHRIMVQIQSTWFPLADRNPGKFMDIYDAKDSDFQKTTQRVYRSPQYPSYLELKTLNE
jgi:putative CocE/NonD family hydrolase